MAYQTVTLTGDYSLIDNTAASGTIEIIPSEKQIIDDTGDVILSGRIKVALVPRTRELLDEEGQPFTLVSGHFSVDLPATDDPSLTPTGFGYTVVAKMHHTHLPAVSFSLPAADLTVDITDVTEADPSTFEPDHHYGTTEELEAYVASAAAASQSSAASATSAATAAELAATIAASIDQGPVGPTGPAGPTTWAGITDKPAEFAPTAHDHPVGDITATGTADATTYLRGDGAWATPASGSSTDAISALIRPTHHRVLRVGPTRTYTTINAAVTAAWADGKGYSDNVSILVDTNRYNQGARIRGGRPMFYRTLILIDPGTYTETVNLEVGEGIDLEGLGATPQDTVIYNATSAYNVRTAGSLYLKNLTLHHGQGPTGNNYPLHAGTQGGVPYFTLVCDSVEFRDTNTTSAGTVGYDLGSGHFAMFYRCEFTSTTGHDSNIHDNATASANEQGIDLPSTVVFLECEGVASNFEATMTNRLNGTVWRIDCLDENGAVLADTVAVNNAAAVPADTRPPLPLGGMTDGERQGYVPTLVKRHSRLIVPNYPDLVAFDPVDGRTYFIPLPAQPFSFIADKVRIRVTTIGGNVAASASQASSNTSTTPVVVPTNPLMLPASRAATLGDMDFETTTGAWNTMFLMVGQRAFVAVRAQATVQLLGSTMMSTIETCYYVDGASGTDVPAFPTGLTAVPAGTTVPYAALLTA